jgi:hypothetical protein
VLHKQDAGRTPYEDIGSASGIKNRDLVKAFITRAMGADKREACNEKPRSRLKAQKEGPKQGSSGRVALPQLSIRERVSSTALRYRNLAFHAAMRTRG